MEYVKSKKWPQKSPKRRLSGLVLRVTVLQDGHAIPSGARWHCTWPVEKEDREERKEISQQKIEPLATQLASVKHLVFSGSVIQAAPSKGGDLF